MAEKDTSSDESEEEDKVTVIKASEEVPEPAPAPLDELEYQLQAEQTEKDKIAAGHYYTDPSDGTCYEWDEVKRAWFPRITEDFLAAYQLSYGTTNQPSETTKSETTDQTAHASSTQPTTDSSATPAGDSSNGDKSISPKPQKEEPSDRSISPKPQKEEPSPLAKKQKKAPEWFQMDSDKNTWVYVSGLPLEMTSEEFLALLGKYGLIMEEQDSGKKKYKMYMDAEGNFKGDAKCCYLRKESLPLAIQMLNGTKLPGSSQKIKIQQATFTMKGEFNAKLKPKKKNNNKKKKKQNHQANLLDWRERAGGDDLRPKHAKIVIMKHCFDPKEFLEDACMITEIRDDIKEECEKLGPVKKVLLFDRHPDGVVSVKFGTHEAAEDAIKVFDKRWFGGKQIEAIQWDGVMDYAIEETAKEREARLQSWHKFIGEGEKDDGPSEIQPVQPIQPIQPVQPVQPVQPEVETTT